ncbi:unnamed protein product [Bursaphelenchus xylophilus]|uniref:(pine wood nematode) hypothetical protein n=1 Tax=Bursaphelenchus xylophilus TaxID=6326 RepID=A0A1I7RZU4_BURXY|nr:unnamed protein product [Bursaphelenchus xylophilus]CAG9109231.1 unnamed protein product [Bursaphelenchus xylophilus]
MSANTAHTADGAGILLYSGEMIILYAKHVEMTFTSITESFFKGKKYGNLYLTSHRIIFLNDDNNALKSLSMPFSCMTDINLEQPLFGANYISGKLTGQPGGNFEGQIGWRLTFPKGGCIDFGKALRQAVIMVQNQGVRPPNAPPPYVPPAGSYFAPPPAYYSANPTHLGQFQAPTNVFPDRPEEGTVYVFEQPPPYAGIPLANQNQLYPDLRQRNVHNPEVPPPYPSESTTNPTAPPNYDDATKLPEKPKVA